jgi:hypothetical protein
VHTTFIANQSCSNREKSNLQNSFRHLKKKRKSDSLSRSNMSPAATISSQINASSSSTTGENATRIDDVECHQIPTREYVDTKVTNIEAQWVSTYGQNVKKINGPHFPISSSRIEYAFYDHFGYYRTGKKLTKKWKDYVKTKK